MSRISWDDAVLDEHRGKVRVTVLLVRAPWGEGVEAMLGFRRRHVDGPEWVGDYQHDTLRVRQWWGDRRSRETLEAACKLADELFAWEGAS